MPRFGRNRPTAQAIPAVDVQPDEKAAETRPVTRLALTLIRQENERYQRAIQEIVDADAEAQQLDPALVAFDPARLVWVEKSA